MTDTSTTEKEIADYIESLQLKKKVTGGVDRTDALLAMKKLSDLYTKQINEIQEDNKRLATRLNDREALLSSFSTTGDQQTADRLVEALRADTEARRADTEELRTRIEALVAKEVSAQMQARTTEEAVTKPASPSEISATTASEKDRLTAADAQVRTMLTKAQIKAESILLDAENEANDIIANAENEAERRADSILRDAYADAADIRREAKAGNS